MKTNYKLVYEMFIIGKNMFYHNIVHNVLIKMLLFQTPTTNLVE